MSPSWNSKRVASLTSSGVFLRLDPPCTSACSVAACARRSSCQTRHDSSGQVCLRLTGVGQFVPKQCVTAGGARRGASAAKPMRPPTVHAVTPSDRACNCAPPLRHAREYSRGHAKVPGRAACRMGSWPPRCAGPSDRCPSTVTAGTDAPRDLPWPRIRSVIVTRHTCREPLDGPACSRGSSWLIRLSLRVTFTHVPSRSRR